MCHCTCHLSSPTAEVVVPEPVADITIVCEMLRVMNSNIIAIKHIAAMMNQAAPIVDPNFGVKSGHEGVPSLGFHLTDPQDDLTDLRQDYDRPEARSMRSFYADDEDESISFSAVPEPVHDFEESDSEMYRLMNAPVGVLEYFDDDLVPEAMVGVADVSDMMHRLNVSANEGDNETLFENDEFGDFEGESAFGMSENLFTPATTEEPGNEENTTFSSGDAGMPGFSDAMGARGSAPDRSADEQGVFADMGFMPSFEPSAGPIDYSQPGDDEDQFALDVAAAYPDAGNNEKDESQEGDDPFSSSGVPEPRNSEGEEDGELFVHLDSESGMPM